MTHSMKKHKIGNDQPPLHGMLNVSKYLIWINLADFDINENISNAKLHKLVQIDKTKNHWVPNKI